jgi:hypothetical protein
MMSPSVASCSRIIIRVAAALLLVVLTAASSRAAAQQTITIQPAGVATVREMPAMDARAPRTSEPVGRVIPFMPGPAPREIGPSSGAQPRQSSPSVDQPEGANPLGPTLGFGFQALGDNNTAIPPDTDGAVGPAHVMTMVNTQVHIQNKAGGSVSLVSLPTFWTSGTGLSGSPFDPHVVYDSISGRWIAATDADGDSATSKVWFAISATNNPTGTWTFYQFVADGSGTTWADYPGFGVNNTWIAITENMFGVGGGGFFGAKAWVIDKATALAGGPLTVTIFPSGFDSDAVCGGPPCGFSLVPAVTFSAAEPALYLVDDSFSSGGTHLIRVSRFTGTGPAPAWSTLPGGPFAGTGLFFVTNNFDGGMIGSPQSGVTATCDGGTNNGNPCSSDAACPPGLPTSSCRLINTNDPRIINVVNRNGRLWFAHAGGLPIGAVDRTAAFWYQVDPVTLAIVQSGVLNGGAGVHYFFPSIAANAVNDAVIGFSRGSATKFVEAVYTSRFADDAPGTMDPISILKAGEDSYLKDFGSKEIRWGDYSATVIDPTDDATFWTIQEYAATDVGPTTDDDRWGLWWGEIAAGPILTPTPSATPTPGPTATPAGDHFTCYKARQTTGFLKFAGIPALPLTDQFGPSTVEVRKPKFLCAPTNKNGEDPTAPAHPEHLKGYQIKNATKPLFPTNIKIVDQFNPGGLFVDAKKQSHLLVPSAKNLVVTPPTPVAFVTDHFECYKIAVTKDTPKFLGIPSITIQDQFGPMTVTVKKPKFLCNPVDKNGEDPTAPTHVNHLVCYQVKQLDAVRFAKITGVFVNNQFGPETLDVRKPSELCLPALKNP